jgi:hypothetical protein
MPSAPTPVKQGGILQRRSARQPSSGESRSRATRPMPTSPSNGGGYTMGRAQAYGTHISRTRPRALAASTRVRRDSTDRQDVPRGEQIRELEREHAQQGARERVGSRPQDQDPVQQAHQPADHANSVRARALRPDATAVEEPPGITPGGSRFCRLCRPFVRVDAKVRFPPAARLSAVRKRTEGTSRPSTLSPNVRSRAWTERMRR